MDFERIARALRFVEENLDGEIGLEDAARAVYFSPYYFHRVFTAIVGKPFAAYLRERRLAKACLLLTETDASILAIALDCGFHSAQAFSRAFRGGIGASPLAYRARGTAARRETVDEMIVRFTNRLKGGMDVHPRIIRRGELRLAAVSGDGALTGDVWKRFMDLIAQREPEGKQSDSGYEVRTYEDAACTVHVGFLVSGAVSAPYEECALPASHYAAFDVYVARGYDSENTAMDEWLRSNAEGWRQRTVGGKNVCVEYYDERFHGGEEDSIVEIWVPIESGKDS